MNVGILTGGGDCPGLNAVIRAATRRLLLESGYSVTGIRRGWKGLLDQQFVPLNLDSTSGILPLGGTIIGTSRTNPAKLDDGPARVLAGMEEGRLDALIAIGGDDTLGVAKRLHEEHGLHVVGVPKTIDNDLSGTDKTFGFDTAVSIATEAIDRLHSTAESHERVMVCEVMGRHTGWIAIISGIAGGADAILLPEFPMTMEDMAEHVTNRVKRGKRWAVLVVSEGARVLWRSGKQEAVLASSEIDAFGNVKLGGVGNLVGSEVQRLTGIETRVTILGYIQRGGSPVPSDRLLATQYGVKAAEMVLERDWGMMAALKGARIEAAPLAEAVGQRKEVPRELYDLSRLFFG